MGVLSNLIRKERVWRQDRVPHCGLQAIIVSYFSRLVRRNEDLQPHRPFVDEKVNTLLDSQTYIYLMRRPDLKDLSRPFLMVHTCLFLLD